jgi:hypothetical protein
LTCGLGVRFAPQLGEVDTPALLKQIESDGLQREVLDVVDDGDGERVGTFVE